MCKYPHLVSAALLVSSLASKASLPALRVSSGVFSSSRQGRQGGKRQGGEQGEVASLPSGVRTQAECEARQRQSGVLTTQGFGNIFIHTCVSCLGVECCDSLLLHSFDSKYEEFGSYVLPQIRKHTTICVYTISPYGQLKRYIFRTGLEVVSKIERFQ